MLTLVIYSIFLVSCHSIPIGTVNQTRFTSVDQLNSDAIWINNQFSPKECLCTVLSQYNNVLLFNSYPNGSCQLFISLPYTYTMEYNFNSTIIFLSPLPPFNQAPCCSNLTWLITLMNNSPLPPVPIANPTYPVIDDLDYLAVLDSNWFLNRYNRTTMAYISSTFIPYAYALSYYNKQYFFTQYLNLSSQLNIYSTAIISNIASISIPYDPRDYVFIQNGTVMVVAIQSTKTIGFYNVTSPTSYILILSLSAPSTPNTLYCVNDTLLYMATNVNSDPIYTLTYNISTNSWIWGNLSLTKSSSTTSNFQLKMDACNRLWVSVYGYGIRIFDRYATKILYNWTLDNYCEGIALTKQFDFYIADWYHNAVLGYQSGIKQCTS